MKNLLVTILGVVITMNCIGQKYYTKNAKINFDATTPSSPEKVEGINRTATCVIDTKSGAMQFVALMKSFEFERALMEEHFNENYVESSKFPKAEFKGELKDNEEIDYSKDGTYTVKVKGILTMHGVSNEVKTDAKIIILNGKISATAEFSAKLEDYKISIPGLVADKVAKSAKITVSCSLEPLKN